MTLISSLMLHIKCKLVSLEHGPPLSMIFTSFERFHALWWWLFSRGRRLFHFSLLRFTLALLGFYLFTLLSLRPMYMLHVNTLHFSRFRRCNISIKASRYYMLHYFKAGIISFYTFIISFPDALCCQRHANSRAAHIIATYISLF